MVVASKDADTVRAKLLYEIKDGVFKDETRLPPEAVLAEKMGVSRTLIRDSLALLEREGFISRRHGIGTLINKHVLAVTTRMDLELEFSDMIKQAGAEPGILQLDIETVFCDDIISKKLDVPLQTPVFAVTRLVSGNGEPVIYCTDYISFQIIKDYTYQREDLEKPIFYFLKHFCDVEVYMDLTAIRAVPASEKLAAALCVDVGAPLLNMDEIGYDIDGRKVLWSSEFYVDKLFEHTVLRKKI